MTMTPKAQTLREADEAILASQPESVKAAFARELKAQSMAAEIRDRIRSIPNHSEAVAQARVYVYDDAVASIAFNKSPTKSVPA